MTRRSSPLALAVLVALAMVTLACGVQPAQQAQTTATPTPAVPSGTVVAFFGTEIPAGWVLCDGRETSTGRLTPDLRGRFVMGLDPANSALGEQGGTVSHRHAGRTAGPNEEDEEIESGEDEHAANDGHTHDFTTNDVSHLPPYVKLVYIMKE